MEFLNNDSRERIHATSEDNATDHKELSHSTKIFQSTTVSNDGVRNAASPKSNDKIISKKCDETHTNLSVKHAHSGGPASSLDSGKRNHAGFAVTPRVSLTCHFHNIQSVY